MKPAILASYTRIAPEKGAEATKIVKDLGITFIFDESKKPIFFRGDHERMTITIGAPGLERLWAAAFAYHAIYNESEQSARSHPEARGVVDLKGNPRRIVALGMLTWALVNEALIASAIRGPEKSAEAAKLEPWADFMPQPSWAAKSKDVHAANELFLCAIGYILHHELAHFYREHRTSDEEQKRLNEKDADEQADRWLLDSVGPEDLKNQKRALGMAIALCWQTALFTHRFITDWGVHPLPDNRLFHAFDRHLGETPSHIVWQFTAAVLSLHACNRGDAPMVALPEFDDHRQAVNSLVDLISKIVVGGAGAKK